MITLVGFVILLEGGGACGFHYSTYMYSYIAIKFAYRFNGKENTLWDEIMIVSLPYYNTKISFNYSMFVENAVVIASKKADSILNASIL